MFTITRQLCEFGNRYRTLLAAGVLLAVVLVILLFVPQPPSPLTQETVHKRISDQRKDMKSAIHIEGGARAYEEFKKIYIPAGFNEGHTAAHLFGEELYIEEQLAGTRVCDNDLNFGCFHGFLSKAISTEGLEVITKLDAACTESFGVRSPACQHGIGHGILEYVGHTHLLDALEACTRTSQVDPVAGCTSGVFMEYNFPIVVSTQDSLITSNTRELADPKNPYDLCPSLENPRFRISCFHELPQWWKQVVTKDFRKLGTLCQAVLDSKEQYACYDGIAQMAASSANYDVNASIDLCKQMPTLAVQKSCLRIASIAFDVSLGDTESARKVCEVIPDVPATFCDPRS